MKRGERKWKENVIFHCLARMKMKRKENEGGEVLHPSPPFLFFSLPNLEENGKESGIHEKKITNYPPLFHTYI